MRSEALPLAGGDEPKRCGGRGGLSGEELAPRDKQLKSLDFALSLGFGFAY